MKTTVKLVTPRTAEEILQKNTMNRTPQLRTIANYARMMSAGLWIEDTGEPIKIAYDGTLLDGQQRLMAIIKSGVSLNFLFIEGLEKEVFKVIDSGKKRTASDVLSCLDVPNYTITAGGIKRYISLKAGRVIGNSAIDAYVTSSGEILSVYNNNNKKWDAIAAMCKLWHKKSGGMLTSSEYIAFYALFFDINEDDAFKFMAQLGEGIDLNYNNPIKLLREKLYMAKSNSKMNMKGSVKTALIIKTWNYFRRGEEIRMLRYAPDIDNFPEPI